ncbi:MAG TPA: FAD-dependent oxidoreductase, partial [bacterium]|nr:FAD-dependent oxidoreductase [bacterium]
AALRSRLPRARVVLFEPGSTHLLKPRLHEALVDDLPLEIPLASLLPRGVQHVRAAVETVEAPSASIVAGGKRHEGDFLIVASGARTRSPIRRAAKSRNAKKGVPAVFRLDSMADVRALKAHVVSCVRHAAGKVSAARRRELLSVLVVGGGYTGVETSAELALLLRREAFEAGISPALVHVTICEAGARLFAGVPDDELAQRVHEELAKKAVDVRVTEEVRFDGGVPMVGRHRFAAATVLLATGIEGVIAPRAPFLARWARWKVDETLRVAGTAGVLAAGDAAVVPAPGDAPPVAPSAQHAVQEGRHAAATIAALVRGRTPEPFRAKTLGEFLTLGDGDVVGWLQLAGRRIHLSGIPAASARAAAFGRYLAALKLGLG